METSNIIKLGIFFVVQTAAAIAAAFRLMSRITSLETRLTDIDRTTVIDNLKIKVAKLETKSEGNDIILMDIKASLIRIEDRLNHEKRD